MAKFFVIVQLGR